MAHKLSILVVDDNRSAADALARVLRKGGDDVEPMYDGWSAIQRIESDPPDVVLTDLKMEPVDGMQVLRAARDRRPPVECLVFTAFGDVDIAVEAMRMGARDFLTKPVTVEQVADRLDSIRAEAAPADGMKERPLPFIARSNAARELHTMLERAAGTASRVWIQGEIGSGRVFAAETLHALGADDVPFHILDLGRETPWPTEGTVVLPNVDDLPDDLQRRLHRRLQYAPAGVRIVATAGPNGRRRVADGTLRAELYYDLAVLVVNVPPLRNRPEDVPPLFDQALASFAKRYTRRKPAPTAESMDEIRRHGWPGNVRELLNLAERMVVMGTDHADFVLVEQQTQVGPSLEPGFNLSNYLESVEKDLLAQALRMCGGDRNAAGKLLGVERNTLRYKLNKYDLLDR